MNSKMKNGKNELVAAAAPADIRLMIHEVHGVQVGLLDSLRKSASDRKEYGVTNPANRR